MATFSIKFWIGIALLVSNQPIGWTAMAICNGLAINRYDLFYSWLGFCIYGLTWGMLGLGVFLSGREGIKYSSGLFKRLWRYLIWWK